MIIKETQTDTNGKYTFNGISNGNYLVIFEYDTSKYAEIGASIPLGDRGFIVSL